MIQFLTSIIIVIMLSGCTSTIELAANLHKQCYLRTIGGCPTDGIGEWKW